MQMTSEAILKTDHVYTVSQLNSEARLFLEENFGSVWIEGEISNFAAPNSGHWYFSLKDTNAQVRCAMFKTQIKKLDFIAKDGMHVLIKARVSLYENRGEFQLIALSMEERGEGKLRRAFELLKKKLAVAGLFAPEHKKPLPKFPKQIGIVTSSTGAAIRDILHVLKRRYATVPVVIYPTLVQGNAAANTIAQAIATANHRNECDVLIVARGGGSLEDLWPFNEEIVAQAIFKSVIPIISGVGHEIDFTIADFVADVRAPTPSAAAELATPDQSELVQVLRRYLQQYKSLILQKMQAMRQQLSWVQKHMAQQHPKRRLTEKMQRIDYYEVCLTQQFLKRLANLKHFVKQQDFKLRSASPTARIRFVQNNLNTVSQRLTAPMITQLHQAQTQLSQLAAKLDALSPLATLKRGFAIAETTKGEVLYSSKQVNEGDEIRVRLMEGNLACIIKNKRQLQNSY